MTSAGLASARAAHPWARPQETPVKPEGWRRVVGTLHEPNAWTVGIVLATGVVLIARHPIAQMIGTETAVRPVTTAQAQAPVAPRAVVPVLTAPLAATPTHAPRDPFRALLTAGGALLAPVEGAPRTTTTPVVTPTAASCTGTSRRVEAGDTLWTLAARVVGSTDSDRVTVAWHRLYAANRGAVGSDPSVLRIGTALCVPTSL